MWRLAWPVSADNARGSHLHLTAPLISLPLPAWQCLVELDSSLAALIGTVCLSDDEDGDGGSDDDACSEDSSSNSDCDEEAGKQASE